MFFLALLDIKGGTRKIKITSNLQDTVILIDVSTSMKAMDVKPNRFEIARIHADFIIKNIKDSRFSLIIFSNYPYIQIPFTDDIKYFSFILNNIDIGKEQKSSYINNALLQSYNILQRTPSQLKNIFIFSDMEFFESLDKTIINKIIEKGIRISFFTIGTKEGSKILFDGKNYLKDKEGNDVITKANPDILSDFEHSSNIFKFAINGLNDQTYTQIIQKIENDKMKKNLMIEVMYKFYWIYGLIAFLLLMLYFSSYSKLVIRIKTSDEFQIEKDNR